MVTGINASGKCFRPQFRNAIRAKKKGPALAPDLIDVTIYIVVMVSDRQRRSAACFRLNRGQNLLGPQGQFRHPGGDADALLGLHADWLKCK